MPTKKKDKEGNIIVDNPIKNVGRTQQNIGFADTSNKRQAERAASKRETDRLRFSGVFDQTPAQAKATAQGIPVEAFRPQDVSRSEFTGATASQTAATNFNLGAQTVALQQERLLELQASQATQRIEALRGLGKPGSKEEVRQQRVEQAQQDVLNAFIDPLAGVVSRGEQAVASSEPGTALRTFNEASLSFTKSLQQTTKAFTVFAYKFIAGKTLGLGKAKDLKESYAEATSNKNQNIEAMNLLIQNLQSGLPVSNARAQFEQYSANIYKNYETVYLLNKNQLNGYLEDGSDTEQDLRNAIDFEIPDLEARFNNAFLRSSI